MLDHLRILLIGSNNPVSIENMYRRAFVRIGVKQVDLFESMPWQQPLAVSRILNRVTLGMQSVAAEIRLEKFLNDGRKKYDLIIVFKGMEFSRGVLEKARLAAGNAVWININPDDPYNVLSRGSSNANVVNSIGFYDGYGIWSKNILERLKNNGCRNPFYLPFAYDPELHYPSKKALTRQGITFVGSWDSDRESILEQLSEVPVEIFGNGWGRIRRRSSLKNRVCKAKEIHGEELRNVISGSALSLNLLRPQNAGSHNMRTFEVPAMHCMMIATRTEEQLSLFEESKEAEYFDSAAELLEKVRFFLKHPREAEKIALAGHEKCTIPGHSYDDRAKTLLKQFLGVSFQ